MKTFMTLMMMGLAIGMANSSFAKEGDWHETIASINDAFIPSGFDSSSEAFVVANGWFQNSCYRLKGVDVKHVGSALHEVTTKAEVREGLCLAVIIPFHREVQLGKLSTGEHKVHFMNGDSTYLEKSLIVE